MLQSTAGLQLAQIAVAGTSAEKALLMDMTAKHPRDASYIELLCLFKASCRRWALEAIPPLHRHTTRRRHERLRARTGAD